MNRRKFIKSAVIASVATSTIVSALTPIEKPERIHTHGEFYEIIPINWLKPYGIRVAPYSACCVDNNGRFAHEKGYQDEYWRSEPFIVQSFRLHCLPKLYSTDPSWTGPIIGKVRSGVNLGARSYTVEGIAQEIKSKMEYVSLVAYFLFPGAPSEAWPPCFIPIVRGLSKYRYNLYLKQLNEQ